MPSIPKHLEIFKDQYMGHGIHILKNEEAYWSDKWSKVNKNYEYTLSKSIVHLSLFYVKVINVHLWSVVVHRALVMHTNRRRKVAKGRHINYCSRILQVPPSKTTPRACGCPSPIGSPLYSPLFNLSSTHAVARPGTHCLVIPDTRLLILQRDPNQRIHCEHWRSQQNIKNIF